MKIDIANHIKFTICKVHGVYFLCIVYVYILYMYCFNVFWFCKLLNHTMHVVDFYSSMFVSDNKYFQQLASRLYICTAIIVSDKMIYIVLSQTCCSFPTWLTNHPEYSSLMYLFQLILCSKRLHFSSSPIATTSTLKWLSDFVTAVPHNDVMLPSMYLWVPCSFHHQFVFHFRYFLRNILVLQQKPS